MTDSSVDPNAYAEILAAHPLMARDDTPDRRRNLRKTLAVAAVIFVHLLAIVLLAFSNKLPAVEKIRVTLPEAIAWIPMPQQASHPLKKLEQPHEQEEEPALPQITAPITLPPIRHKELEPPAPGGLEGVGRSLACGASSFENLSAAQREACLRHPWAYVKRPDGTIVLDTQRANEPSPTAIDILRHQQETSSPCPVLSNVPCLGKVIHGGGGLAPPQQF